MPQLIADIPASLMAALEAEAARSGRSVSSILVAALARYLEKPTHTVFQVSTSGALVAGVYDREVSAETILRHGDFGLGTFANLDGEMVVLDGRVFQIQGSGRVAEAARDAGAPFAVVTWFKPETVASIGPVRSFKDLEAGCDAFRRSGNIFYALQQEHNRGIGLRRTSSLTGEHPCFMVRTSWPKPVRSSWCARSRPKGSPMSSASRGQRLTQYSTLLVDSKIKTVVCCYEQNATFIAGGIGRMTGRAGVAIATSGPGVSNLTTGLATANSEEDPVVALGGAVAVGEALKQIHQTMDAVSILKPVTKYSVTVGAPDHVSEVMANAFRAAEGGLPGAAYVNLPMM